MTVRSFLVHSEAVEAGHFFIMSLLSDSDMTTEEDLEHTQDVGKIRYSEQTPDCFFFFFFKKYHLLMKCGRGSG